MEQKESFKKQVFNLLHGSQKELRYRMLTSSKNKLAEKIDEMCIELMNEYISMAIEAAEASWLEEKYAELDISEVEDTIHPEPEPETPWWQKRIFGKKA